MHTFSWIWLSGTTVDARCIHCTLQKKKDSFHSFFSECIFFSNIRIVRFLCHIFDQCRSGLIFDGISITCCTHWNNQKHLSFSKETFISELPVTTTKLKSLIVSSDWEYLKLVILFNHFFQGINTSSKLIYLTNHNWEST